MELLDSGLILVIFGSFVLGLIPGMFYAFSMKGRFLEQSRLEGHQEAQEQAKREKEELSENLAKDLFSVRDSIIHSVGAYERVARLLDEKLPSASGKKLSLQDAETPQMQLSFRENQNVVDIESSTSELQVDEIQDDESIQQEEQPEQVAEHSAEHSADRDSSEPEINHDSTVKQAKDLKLEKATIH